VLLATLLTPAVASAKAPAATFNVLTAKLVTSPAPGVNLTVNYSCTPGVFGPTGGFEVFLDQPPGGFSVTVMSATCDDQNHMVTLFLPGAFHTGLATVFAVITNASGTAQKVTSVEVNITS
jgi:hypothetical protein